MVSILFLCLIKITKKVLGDRGDLCKVYSLDYMLFLLKNAVAENQVWPVVSLSTEELERDVYDYTIEIACDVS